MTPDSRTSRINGDAQPNDVLVSTVEELRREIAGLRASAQLRAMIEQAKGILVERHGITLNEAFIRLRKMSQEHNVRLVEVAATVVGVAVPASESAEFARAGEALRARLPSSAAASTTWMSLREQPDVRDGVMSALLDSVAGAAQDGDEAAQLMLELLAPFRVAKLIIYRAALDGSLRSVGQVGLPGDFLSSWRSVPPAVDIPVIRALVEDSAFFWSDSAERGKLFPAVNEGNFPFEAAAVIAVRESGAPCGVVALMWDGAEQFDETRKKAITSLVERVGPLLLRHVASADPELDWLNTMLGLHLDPWVLLDSLPAADGSVRDFVVTDVSVQLADGNEWLGRRMLELWPNLALDGTFEAVRGLIRTGGSWTTTTLIETDGPWGQPGSLVRAVRLGRRVVVVWRPRGA